ncbi:hypothetical protein LOCC1_G008328 [Lachnellula occidentalis]|uniref:NB-ARC domain-containing protein n=1 Tax=Lachnellula occidentalis TaxID=215460 RepID=A0A8H8REC2_9HELO|nr:hypothetical protein LOCC1_G008328 [Lachnellula occidentalis]
MSTEFTFLREIYISSPPEDAEVDIIAIHGFSPLETPKHAEDTWTAASSQKMWLRDFLPHKVPKSRIFLSGYWTNSAFLSGTAHIDDHAEDLFSRLMHKRKHCPDRPIIFICHSLGALIVKRGLFICNGNHKFLLPIYKATYGLVLFATPHRDNKQSGTGDIVASIAKGIVGFEANKLLSGLGYNRLFVKLMRNTERAYSHVATFYETLPVPDIGIVVEKDSAVIGLPGGLEIGLEIKFEEEDGDDFRPVWQEIQALVEAAINNAKWVMVQPLPYDVHADSVGDAKQRDYSGEYRVAFNLDRGPTVSKFVGRPGEMRELERTLLPKQLSGRQKKFVLIGIGGIGKTQLAVEFSRQHHHEFSAVFWLDGSSEDSVKRSIVSCASRIPEGQISKSSRIHSADIKLIIQEVLSWLARQNNTDWLLIFDNVERKYSRRNPDPDAYDPDAYDITRYFPDAHHGSILITTRLAKLVHSTRFFSRLRVGKVNKHQAEAILRNVYTNCSEETHSTDGDALTNPAEVERLLELLDGLPLAINHVGAQLRKSGIGLERYIKLFEQQKELTESESRGGALASNVTTSLGLLERGLWGDSTETATAMSHDSGYASMESKQLLEAKSNELDTKSIALSTALKIAARLETVMKSNSEFQRTLEDSSSLEKPKDPGFPKWVKNAFRRSLRPPILLGSQRIEWICKCGDLLHMDFDSNSTGSFPTMKALLRFQSATLQPSGSSDAPGQPLPRALRMPIQAHSRENIAQSLATQSDPVTGLHSSNTPHTSPGALAKASTALTPSLIFLELCVNTGKYLKSLGEIDVSSIDTDGDFFATVKAHYLQLRGFRARFWLLKPMTVSYVRFSVEDRCRVGILHKPIALPPKPEVDAKRYLYNPCPLENELPISSDLFLHYLFSCSAPSHNLIWLPRIPRKLDTSILASPTPASFGWGVHINEGPDYLTIFILNLVVLGASGVAALLWTFFRHDFQGAMALAAWIVMLLNTLMLVFVAKWSQE